MELIRRYCESSLQKEYGLEGIRLLPWAGLRAPFSGGYCIVRPGCTSESHVNSPPDEEELFICIAGTARIAVGAEVHIVRAGDIVFIPRSTVHFVQNESTEPFHFYTLWWNSQTISPCVLVA